MNFVEAVASVFGKYATFSGRARRSEYWWFFLFDVIVSVVMFAVDTAIKTPIPGLIVSLALLLPALAVTVRRLHDTGRSGWFILIGIIPIVGSIVLIVFACQDSQPGENQYGPSPKHEAAPAYRH